MAEPSVQVRDLVVRYGDVTAVAGATFDARPGEVTVVLGPNGAGKSSTIEALEGFRVPAAGTLSVLGLDPRRDHEQLVRRIGVMLQGGGVAPAMRVGEAIRLDATFHDRPREPAELLAAVGLAGCERRTWRQLSGGQQQRLLLALALVGRPEVAFLDEPTSGVDVEGRVAIRAIVRRLAGDGATVVLTTHELDEAARLADRVVILAGGRVRADGTVAELTGGDGIRFEPVSAVDVTALAAHLGGPVEPAGGTRLVARVAATPANVARLTAWLADRDVAVGEVRAGGRTLEEAYLDAVGAPAGAETAAAGETP